MDAALAALVFAPALALGSFLNVVAARLPERRSLVQPRSACPACGTEIAWYDNVPLVSYARAARPLPALRRAASAGATPPSSSPPALLVAACFFRFGLTGEALVAAFFCAALVVLSAIDVERRILPDLIVLPSSAIVLAANIALYPEPPVEWVAASLGASLFLFLALLAYPRGMGMGDVKLALLLGAGLGKAVGGRDDGRHARRARRRDRALRPARAGGAEDGDPVRAVPRLRGPRRALRGRAPPLAT